MSSDKLRFLDLIQSSKVGGGLGGGGFSGNEVGGNINGDGGGNSGSDCSNTGGGDSGGGGGSSDGGRVKNGSWIQRFRQSKVTCETTTINTIYFLQFLTFIYRGLMT